MATLKQTRLLKEVMNPENKTMLEAGRKAGYKLDKGSKQIYRASTKRHVLNELEAQGITRESLGAAYKGLINLCIKEKDYSTAKGSLDSLGKLNNLLKEGNNLQAIEKVVISYGDMPPKCDSDKNEDIQAQLDKGI